MGLLKQNEQIIDQKSEVIKAVLSHFDSKTKKNEGLTEKISKAAFKAYSDDLLFEEFEIWFEEREDEAFLYQIDHFWKNKDKQPLPMKERDLTGNEAEIESIKTRAKEGVKIRFSQNLRKLADRKGLDTNEKLGDFLGKSGEQARVLLSGEHKPQRKTLNLIAKKFEVTVEDLV